MQQKHILTLKKEVLLVVLLLHSTGLWAQWWDTIYITAPSGQTLMCQSYNGPTFTRYTLIGDTSISGNLIVPNTIIWPYTDSDGITHYPTYTVSNFSFKNCHNLLSVAIQEGFTNINNSFEGCTGLISVTLPSTIVSITGNAFKNCHSLQTINIPNGVTTIGYGSFEGCSSLENISLPNSITSLGGNAFAECTSLTSIVIPPSVDSILGGTFHNCTSLQSATLPDSLRVIGTYEFYYGSEAPMYHTRGIGAFEGCTALTSIVLPNTIRHIWNYSFLGCTNLSTITFPDSLERIGSLAFSECGLTNLVLPNNLLQLDYGVFSRCVNLQEATISSNVWNIGFATFDSCVHLTTVNFNADSCYWGGGPGYCFSGGTSTYCIEGRVWHNCSNLTQVNIGNNVRYLMGNLFYDLTSLSEITIPHSVRKIANGTFVGCTGLTTVNLYADSVNYPSSGSSGAPFIGCSSLSTLNIGNNVTIIPPDFMSGVSSLNNIILPESIRIISHDAFRGCATEQSVLIIPNSVDSIAASSFRYCNFDTLILGTSLRYIGSNAFNNTTIETIIINTNTPPFIYNEDNSNYYNNPSFSYDVYDNADLYVPCRLIETYRTSLWGAFENIHSTHLELIVNANGHGAVEILYDSVCTNSTASIMAIPEAGYYFSHWSDGDTTNPRTIVLTQDTSLTAYFTEVSFDCDSISLPYTADFTQCWIASGGANIIDSNHASITSQGQTLVSPWIEVPAGQTYLYFTVLRGNGQWQYLNDSSRYFTRRIVDTDGNIIWLASDHASSSSNGFYSYFISDGGLVRVEITYSDPSPAWMFEVTDLHMYQYPMDMTIDAPETVHIGDTVSLLAHLTIPTGETAEWEWTFRNGLEYNDFVAAADTTMLASTDSSKTLVWNTPGTYYVNVDVHHWNPYAYVSIRHIITVLDTTTVDCDSIRLPYSADFTQCWTTSGGATIIDINHASITSQGQRLVGPWMASTEGKCFIDWSMSRIGEINYNSEQYTLTIEGEDSVITSWIEYAGNWSIGDNFTSPGGRIRVVFEYTGASAVPTFQITDIRIFQYDIEATLEASSSIAQVGDTITFIIHSTLQNGEVPDNYSMDTYNSQGQWMYENDPDRTIVSNTDSIYKVVWNTAGRYRVYGGVHKYVDNTGWAYATSSLGIIITDHPVYAEDSIYYTSAAKDTVIGCHPDLHVANLPESITVIADSAFFNLSNLSIIELPIGLRTIGKMAFAWNQGISEITIPQNVTFVGDNAFCWDTNLTTVNFNATNCQTMSPSTDENGNYWPIFIGCDNITTINIGENVTRIPDRAFSYCSGLHGTLTIPDAVTYIGRSAFYHWINDWDWDNGSSWDTLSIVLGAGLTEIGDYAFGCPRAHITSVISHNPEPPIIGEQTFYRYEPEYTPRLQVPCGSAAAYRNAQHWSRIEEIIEDCDGIEDAENDARTPAILSDNGIITVVGATELVSVYDMMGRLVSAYMPTDFRCTIVVPHSGVYMVKIGDCPARKIVVVK